MKVEKAFKSEHSDSDSPLVFRLDPQSGVPTYVQLVQQVEQALRLGHLRAGDRLPRVREVVADLAINPNTVLKAYRDLEQKGLASGRPGLGTFVEGSLEQSTVLQVAELRESLRAWLRDAATAGLDSDGIVALVTATLREGPITGDLGARPDAVGRRKVGGVA